MKSGQQTAKPATAETVNGLRNIEQLPGRLDNDNTRVTRQAQHLRRLFALSVTTANTLAELAYHAGLPR